MNNYKIFLNDLEPNNYKLNESLAPYTTVRIGGCADILYFAKSKDDFRKIVSRCNKYNIQCFVLGGGSNTLISDEGYRGVIIKPEFSSITIGEEKIVHTPSNKKIEARWQSDNTRGTFRGTEFKDLDYDESDCEKVPVTVEAGMLLQPFIKYTINNGLTGMQWYAYIPGTIGGAVFNNLHGGTHFLSEVIIEVTVCNQQGEVFKLPSDELGFEYDKSVFQKQHLYILEVTLALNKGDAARAEYVYNEWFKRKSATQKMNSVGCVFANISNEDKERLGYPTTSVGYIVEHVLKMSGFRVGDAVISPTHHNFILNEGKATAKDYLAVINEIKKRAKEEIGLDLKTEIVYLR